jgi:hypothetical protein
MTTSVIETTTTGNGSLTSSGEAEQTLLLLFADRYEREIRRRELEDAAIEAEDILMQAEEANALDPVG